MSPAIPDTPSAADSESQRRPLRGILVVELAGLAPVPFAGMILADLGATVLRIDRPKTNTLAPDYLTRGKRALHLDLKSSPRDRARLLLLLSVADMLLDPYRPQVLESILGGMDPKDFVTHHAPQLIVGRLVGFPRTVPGHAHMAGHDLNYLALSGVLSLLGRRGDRPAFPHNLLADFAGGSLMLVLGLLSALIARQGSWGKGRVVDINMVHGAQYLASFLRAFHLRGLLFPERGSNLLDSGAHNYDVYETKDTGRYVSLAALEPQFYAAFIQLLTKHRLATAEELRVLTQGSVLQGWEEKKQVLEAVFKRHEYTVWESVGMGADACLVGVREMDEVGRGDWPRFTGAGFDKVGTSGEGEELGWEVIGDDRVVEWEAVEAMIQARQARGQSGRSKAKL